MIEHRDGLGNACIGLAAIVALLFIVYWQTRE